MENLDFLNLNSYRAFPVKEGVSRVSIDGLFTIPDDFMVDMLITVDSNASARYYISKISNTPSEIVIEISNDSDVLIGSFNVTVAEHTLYKEYYFTPTEDFAGANGKVTVAMLDTILKLPTGPFPFTLNTGELESRVSIPCVGGINRFVFRDNNQTEFSITGNVNVTARSNMKFHLDSGVVYLDAGNGLGLNTTPPDSVPPIRTINNIAPDGDGNFTITMLDCENLTPVANGLVLADSCNKPCLGCDDIGELTDRLIALDTDLLALRKYYDDLNLLTIQLNNVINFSCELQ